MRAILVRAGIDQSYGRWNAPVDPVTNDFVYVPIPEATGEIFHPGLERQFSECLPFLRAFCERQNLDLDLDLRLPHTLSGRAMHLDPDFNELTYGDVGDRRGREIAKLKGGDLLVFYAGLKPVRPCGHRLLYALTGFYVVDEVVAASDIPSARWQENAHTRRYNPRPTDIVVRARRGVSGRLTRCVAIGEWRDRAYRVRQDVLDEWGGLSVKDGYLQRSAVPPNFLDAEQFYRWFGSLGIPLVAANNAGV